MDNNYKVMVITNSGQHIKAVVETGVNVRLTFGRIVPRALNHTGRATRSRVWTRNVLAPLHAAAELFHA